MLNTTMETYLYHRYDEPIQSGPVDTYPTDKIINDAMLEAQKGAAEPSRLSWWRIAIIGLGVSFMIGILVAMIILVRVDDSHMAMGQASHWLMGGSGGIILLAALTMFAAKRPLAEILVLAMLGVLICQCVMDDFHAKKS